MKKFSSIFMLAMMMIAALVSLSACSSDDDEEGGNTGNSTSDQQTLTIDGKSYYYGILCFAEQTRNNGKVCQGCHVTSFLNFGKK